MIRLAASCQHLSQLLFEGRCILLGAVSPVSIVVGSISATSCRRADTCIYANGCEKNFGAKHRSWPQEQGGEAVIKHSHSEVFWSTVKASSIASIEQERVCNVGYVL